MSFSKIVRREIEVAFSKHSQPVWFRIFKYIFLGCILFLFWKSRWLGPTLIFLLVFSILLHLWFRYKTHCWTRSYGLWKYDQNKPEQKNKR
ncbi:hypothetical protein [Leptospira santarosai]|uniref:PF04304 family protein n=1 Tax=Leptospira santarosai TaxID=28183 RepID=A0AB73LKK0_9LEPT|nr:hypothetical protein [Leptospira santarosai]MDI7166958.1 hypothetical protein [Leptospira santarosai]MDO6395051.1 hypothetical protein [Leptospira santarosai]ONF91053.1 hypothetical protein BWD14_18715 [Leptospira santarosai]